MSGFCLVEMTLQKEIEPMKAERALRTVDKSNPSEEERRDG